MSSIVGAGGSPHALSVSSGHENLAHAKASGSGALGLAKATSFAGGHADHVVASQSHVGGNLVLQFHDGSTITVVGVSHIDTTFIH